MSAARGSKRDRRQPASAAPARTIDQPGPFLNDGTSGLALVPGPLGLGDRFPWEASLPEAPATVLVENRGENSAGGSSFQYPATGAGRGAFGATRHENIRDRARGRSSVSSDDESETAAVEGTRGPSAIASVRDKLSPEAVAQLRAIMNDPDLALNMLTREIVAKIGRYGETGDKTGIKRSVMELVERLDVSSPKDGAVLMAQQTLGGIQVPASQVLATLEDGKQSPQTTQAGRTLSALAPILRENGVFGAKDGMDRGWGRLNERFAEQAHGVVDVVVGARGVDASPAVAGSAPSAAPPGAGQVGAWNTAPSGATPVGSWSLPTDAASSSGAAESAGPVGQWSAAPPGGTAPGAAAPVGTWKMPDPSAPDGADGGIGNWTLAADAKGGPPASPVGQWAVPEAPGGAEPAPVGTWGVPDAADPKAQVGQWTVAPDAASKVGGAPGEMPVGTWSTPEGTAAGFKDRTVDNSRCQSRRPSPVNPSGSGGRSRDHRERVSGDDRRGDRVRWIESRVLSRAGSI